MDVKQVGYDSLFGLLPVTNSELGGEPEWVTPPIALLPVWMKWGLSLNSATHANKAHTEQCLKAKTKNCP